MTTDAPDIRYFIARLTTRGLLEAEETGKATILLTRNGPPSDNESALVEEIVTKQYQDAYDRVVVSITAVQVTLDTYNTQRIMLKAAQGKGDANG